MSRTEVRNVLSRALYDSQFRNAMLADPKAALAEFDLTDRERSILAAQDAGVYALMEEAEAPDAGVPPDAGPDGGTDGGGGGPVTLVVVVVICVIIFVPAIAGQPSPVTPPGMADLARQIRRSAGPSRHDLILDLLAAFASGTTGD